MELWCGLLTLKGSPFNLVSALGEHRTFPVPEHSLIHGSAVRKSGAFVLEFEHIHLDRAFGSSVDELVDVGVAG